MSASQRIGVVDYGTGNLASVVRAFERLGVCAVVASKPVDLKHVDKLVLPGIGHYGRTMEELRRRELLDALNEASRGRQMPTLGICLGMHLMMTHGEEGDAPGLGWVPGRAVRLRVEDPLRYKIPHIGYSRVSVTKREPLFTEVPGDAEFYYAHSYIVDVCDPDAVAGESLYARPFPVALVCGNLLGVQFHPEKSHHAGQLVLENFVAV